MNAPRRQLVFPMLLSFLAGGSLACSTMAPRLQAASLAERGGQASPVVPSPVAWEVSGVAESQSQPQTSAPVVVESAPLQGPPGHAGAVLQAPGSSPSEGPGLAAIRGPGVAMLATTSDERRDLLDERFARELSELDALLVHEQVRLAQEREESASYGEGSLGGGALEGGASAEGSDPGEAGSAAAEAGLEGQEGQAGTQGSGGSTGAAGTGSAQTAPAEPAPGVGKPRPGCPDDIVAKQIREAARAEQDAALAARLWKEYENYKNATCAKRSKGDPPSKKSKK